MNTTIFINDFPQVSDVNDNVPKFELPDYQAHNVREDIAIGTPILKVTDHIIRSDASV